MMFGNLIILTLTPNEKLVLCHVTMDTPVTLVTSGKSRSELKFQNFENFENLALLYGA